VVGAARRPYHNRISTPTRPTTRTRVCRVSQRSSRTVRQKNSGNGSAPEILSSREVVYDTTMKANLFRSWAGFISVVWIALAYVFFQLFPPYRYEPYTICLCLVFFGWWGVGLLFAVSALRRGPLVSRVFATLTVCAFAYFVWYNLSPMFIRPLSR
jgi:hypothetical protein